MAIANTLGWLARPLVAEISCALIVNYRLHRLPNIRSLPRPPLYPRYTKPPLLLFQPPPLTIEPLPATPAQPPAAAPQHLHQPQSANQVNSHCCTVTSPPHLTSKTNPVSGPDLANLAQKAPAKYPATLAKLPPLSANKNPPRGRWGGNHRGTPNSWTPSPWRLVGYHGNGSRAWQPQPEVTYTCRQGGRRALLHSIDLLDVIIDFRHDVTQLNIKPDDLSCIMLNMGCGGQADAAGREEKEPPTILRINSTLI